MHTIYTLQHVHTGERVFRTYRTRAGARIAQANRNRLLGFKNRVERVVDETHNSEEERYLLASGEIVSGTYIVVELLVDDEEFERLFSSEA